MSNTSVYNTNLSHIQYTNDIEYRECLRQVFHMSSMEKNEFDIDPVTHDENDYDGDSATKAMDYIYNKTKEHVAFQTLYDIAASKMLSTDREIGLAVLFSYDYLSLFHDCILAYIQSPDGFDENNASYCALHLKIR